MSYNYHYKYSTYPLSQSLSEIHYKLNLYGLRFIAIFKQPKKKSTKKQKSSKMGWRYRMNNNSRYFGSGQSASSTISSSLSIW